MKISRKELKQRIADMIREYTEAGPLFLVFHDGSQDLKCVAPRLLLVSSVF